MAESTTAGVSREEYLMRISRCGADLNTQSWAARRRIIITTNLLGTHARIRG